MLIEDLIAKAEKLEKALQDSEGEVREALHRELHECLDSIRLKGGEVPATLRELDLTLTDEEVEDMFDNMPV